MLAVFVAPPWLRLVSEVTAERALGLAVLLLVGYAFALAGHYEMFNPRTSRSFRAFPFQEKVAVFSVVLLSAIYIGVAVTK